ncbi:MAG: hypothetical protein ACI9YM_001998 [Brevundimonas sp.]|jgi:hypothetical protein|uniref:hypothetical protein n=1 Tax=Brevundimonas sp. TaxID=1871086 RepID=UPI002487E282|nr:hypothetical protein [Brevundimonas sp.]MDI1280970.1 hypothetical protein [Brevundimonas sp.]
MFKRVLVAAMAMTVAACASPYVATPYDRSTASVQSIALIDDSVPEKAIAYEVASVGGNFGLIGALVDAGIQAERQGAVNEALDGLGFEAESTLEARVIEALGQQGYTAAPLTGADRAKRDFLETYPEAPAGVDGYLDIAIVQYGYMSAGAGQPFRPTVGAKVKLVKVSDGSTLMENMIVYNPLNTVEGVVTLAPNPDYEFRNRAALLENPERLAAGIEDALNQVADTAARLLR